MKKLLVALVLVCGLALTLGASELIWLSSQFEPIEEAEWVRGELLPPFTSETGIDVTFIGSEYAEFIDRLTAEYQAGSGTVGVICGMHGDMVSAIDTLADVSTALAGVEGTIAPSAVELGQMGGIQAYVPMMQATYIMVINKKALVYLPAGVDIWALTYDDLLAWSKAIYDATGEKKLGIPAGPSSLLHRFIHGYLYPSFTGYQVLKFDSPAAVAMWKYMQELWGYVSPAAPTWDSMELPLLSEEVLIAWDHTARVKQSIAERPDDFIAIPSPTGPAGLGFISVMVGLGIPRTSPDPAAAASLIKYLTSADTQVKILQDVGFFPVLQEASGAVPTGALQILAAGVSAQASSPDAIPALIPGGIGDEYKKIYRDTFVEIVIQGETDIASLLLTQGQAMRALYLATGADYPVPDK